MRTSGPGWQFTVGDWVAYGRRRAYGRRYADAVELTGLRYQTVANIVYVAWRVPPRRRRVGLSWGHHAEVAALTPDEQNLWLERAVDEAMTRAQLRAALRRAREG